LTEMRDPIEIYRASLQLLPERSETEPPRIVRAEVWPYPDLTRLWVRVEITPFAAYPNMLLTALGADGIEVASMLMVEIREPYQSVTLHLRREPRPGERYRMEIELARDEVALDRRSVDFDLLFKEPGAA